MFGEPKGKGTAPYLAEFLGAFFVAVAHGAVAMNSSAAWGATAVGYVVMVAMYAMADVSGGLLNPAISLAFGLSGRLPWTRTVGYCTAQVAAGLFGGLVASVLRADGGAGAAGVAYTEPEGGLRALVLEAFYASVICFVALNCMGCRAGIASVRNQFGALAVGFVSIAGGYAVAGISCGIFNPATTLTFAVLHLLDKDQPATNLSFLSAAAYIGVQVGGAFLASTLFFLVRPEELRATGQAVEPARSQVETSPSKSACSPRLFSEYIGTFVVVLTMILSTIPYSGSVLPEMRVTTASPDKNMQVMPPTPASWAVGVIIVSMVCSLCSVSGSHLNPAVTLAVVCTSRPQLCSPFEGLLYALVQCAAGFSAGAACALLRPDVDASVASLRSLGPKHDHTWTTVAAAEMLFSMVFCLVVLCVTTLQTSLRYPKAPRSGSFHVGLAVGFAMAAGAFALENISGGQLNPAMALCTASTAFVRGVKITLLVTPLAIYEMWQLLGGVLAAVLFVMLHPLEYKQDPLLARADA